MFVNCPHCNQFFEIVELNCCIFRCGVYKNNFVQINPHLTKIECERLIKKNEIYGCGRPFKIAFVGTKTLIVECDYI